MSGVGSVSLAQSKHCKLNFLLQDATPVTESKNQCLKLQSNAGLINFTTDPM